MSFHLLISHFQFSTHQPNNPSRRRPQRQHHSKLKLEYPLLYVLNYVSLDKRIQRYDLYRLGVVPSDCHDGDARWKYPRQDNQIIIIWFPPSWILISSHFRLRHTYTEQPITALYASVDGSGYSWVAGSGNFHPRLIWLFRYIRVKRKIQFFTHQDLGNGK